MQHEMFDPPAVVCAAEADLAELARQINEANAAGEKCRARGLEHFRRCGEALIRARALIRKELGHGHWLGWLKEHTQFGRSWAYTLIAWAEFPAAGNSEDQEDAWRRISGHAPPTDDEEVTPPTPPPATDVDVDTDAGDEPGDDADADADVDADQVPATADVDADVGDGAATDADDGADDDADAGAGDDPADDPGDDADADADDDADDGADADVDDGDSADAAADTAAGGPSDSPASAPSPSPSPAPKPAAGRPQARRGPDGKARLYELLRPLLDELEVLGVTRSGMRTPQSLLNLSYKLRRVFVGKDDEAQTRDARLKVARGRSPSPEPPPDRFLAGLELHERFVAVEMFCGELDPEEREEVRRILGRGDGADAVDALRGTGD